MFGICVRRAVHSNLNDEFSDKSHNLKIALKTKKKTVDPTSPLLNARPLSVVAISVIPAIRTHHKHTTTCLFSTPLVVQRFPRFICWCWHIPIFGRTRWRRATTERRFSVRIRSSENSLHKLLFSNGRCDSGRARALSWRRPAENRIHVIQLAVSSPGDCCSKTGTTIFGRVSVLITRELSGSWRDYT